MRTPNQDARQAYIESMFPIQHQSMRQSKEVSKASGMDGISMSSAEVQILSWAVHSLKLSKIVEIGTLSGFSGLALLHALAPGGTLWTFEKDPMRAQQAENLLAPEATQISKKAFVVVGDAEVQLQTIESEGPFDGIFIDGNKGAYGRYLDWAEKNLKRGGLIMADNIFLSGTVYGEANPRFSEKQIQVMRQFNQRLCDARQFETCLIPTIEGLLLAIKKT